ncbi:HNH endonuclease family protein [Actinomyces respiraculi]|uniref:HNH endonuclease family protein n=1 Tax=Actinomyces respiraculi TaxID=2744574 RepID=UPI001422D049|nr:HNH endonuclease family protein [Actinomyces respiraculi]
MGDAIEELLASQTATVSYWPDDVELRTALVDERVYTTLVRARLRMLLEAVEDEQRGYPHGHRRSETPVVRGVGTAEHLLPKQWRLRWDPDGRIAADDAAARRRDHLLRTLGNLTLMTQRLNSSLSNSAWPDKRRAIDDATLLLTTRAVTTAHPDAWTEEDIRGRTGCLIDAISRIWPVPAGHVHRIVPPARRLHPRRPARPGPRRVRSPGPWILRQ